MERRTPRQFRNRRGAMMILIAVVMVILFIGAVFSVDSAYMHMVRAELKSATDAASRAGASTLARTQDRNRALNSIVDYARKNKVAGVGLTVLPSQIEFGSVTPSGQKLNFAPNQSPTIAVKVNGRRDDGSADGSVRLFFGPILNVTRFQPVQSSTSAANVRDVALVLDVSGSMAIPLGAGTRMSALKTSVNTFLDELQTASPLAQVSLSVYSTTASPLIPLTDNLGSIRARVQQLQPDGFTAIGEGLRVGVNSLLNDPASRPFAAKTIIVMTDGIHNTGVNPLVTVQNAVRNNQTVHTITFSPDANQTLMQQVAAATTGGRHFHADDAADLTDAFREIARSLSVILID